MAIKKNMERIEQIIRLVLGAILLVVALVMGGVSGWILGLVGLSSIVTGIVTY